MRVSILYGSYNPRRYSKPWIGKVTAWPVGGKPEMTWGAFVGSEGGSGEVEIEAEVGDVIRDGQKDYRGNNGTSDWSVVEADGTLRKIDATEARKLFRAS